MTNNTFLKWLPIAVMITIIFGTIYVAIQQQIRQDANDPQIASAEDASAAIHTGYSAPELLQEVPRSDMSQSLEPFMMFFDTSGQLLGSSASYGSSTPPTPPAGVFQSAEMQGEDRFTWQTSSGLRFAAVLVPWSQAPASTSADVSEVAPASGDPTSGFLLVARSLRDVEARESHIGFIVFMGWLLSILVSAAGFWMFMPKKQQ